MKFTFSSAMSHVASIENSFVRYSDDSGKEILLMNLFSVGKVSLLVAFEQYQDTLLEYKRWIMDFLCRPNSLLGRKGDVCPFTMQAFSKGLFWLNVQPVHGETIEEMAAIVNGFLNTFLELEPTSGGNVQYKTINILFPFMKSDRWIELIDGCQLLLKKQFVQKGLMIGQFHPYCEQGGLHNDDFKPLQAPFPLLAIRNMVPTDYPFLNDGGELEAAYNKLYGKYNEAKMQRKSLAG